MTGPFLRILFAAGAAILALALAVGAAEYRWHDGVRFPDPEATPGDTRPVPLATLCRVGYTDTVRDTPTAQRRRVLAAYGIRWADRGRYELDHFVPLGLGGTNADANMWPQPYTPRPAAREKDVLELFLRRAVCTGAIPLDHAQRDIAADWWSAYGRLKRGAYP